MGTGVSYGTVKEPFSLDNLTVEVKCQNADDKGIRRILEFLDVYGVQSENIKIQEPANIIEPEDYCNNKLPSLSKFTLNNFSVLIFVQSASVCQIIEKKY